MSIINKMKMRLKQRLTGEQWAALERIWVNFLGHVFSRNLTKLAKLYGTDKAWDHQYTPHYMTHFKKYRKKRVKLLEIGVGGFERPDVGGGSLRMWKKYFPFGKIYAIDIYDKSALQEPRIRIYQGSQIDPDFLNKITDEVGEFDMIVDDGSHINDHVIQTFNMLFPKLKDGGVYAIEDIQTSYWENYGGDSKDLNNPRTSMNFFKSLTDGLNHQEICDGNYEESYFDKKIVSIHFYHNMVFIHKGDNTEASNIVKHHHSGE